MVIYIEGGSRDEKVNANLRRAWGKFLSNAGINNLPKIKISKAQMIKKFTSNYENADIILLDSEVEVRSDKEDKKAAELKFIKKIKTRRDWKEEQKIPNNRIHLMVACMESWLIADINTLKIFYGNGFNENAIGNINDVEIIPKNDILMKLKNASKNTKKGQYHKTHHVSNLSAKVVCDKSYFCQRFLNHLRKSGGLK